MMIRKEETSIRRLAALQVNVKVPVGHAFIDSYRSNVVFKHRSDAGSANHPESIGSFSPKLSSPSEHVPENDGLQSFS